MTIIPMSFQNRSASDTERDPRYEANPSAGLRRQLPPSKPGGDSSPPESPILPPLIYRRYLGLEYGNIGGFMLASCFIIEVLGLCFNFLALAAPHPSTAQVGSG